MAQGPPGRRIVRVRISSVFEEPDFYTAHDATIEVEKQKPGEEYLELPGIPVLDPEQGGMDLRVATDHVAESAKKEISPEETAYWFMTPPGGWEEKEPLKAAIECEVPFPNPGPHEDYVEYRVPLSDIKVGHEVEGVITDVWLYHGVQVDFGGEYDGLIPVSLQEWKDVRDDFLPGIMVKARVYDMRPLPLYRWPIQLELIDEPDAERKLAPLVTPPEQYAASPPINMGWCTDQGWDMDRIMRETGRTYKTAEYLLEQDHSDAAAEIQRSMGWDEPDINGYAMDDVMTNLDAYTQQQLERQLAANVEAAQAQEAEMERQRIERQMEVWEEPRPAGGAP